MSSALLSGLSRTAEPVTSLRRFLALDAVVTGANGLVYAALSGPVAELLGVGRGLVLGIGVFLLVYAAEVAWLASRREPSAFLTKMVIEANYAWAVLSVVALFVWFDATAVGTFWIPAQALVVAGFAVLQQMALKETGR